MNRRILCSAIALCFLLSGCAARSTPRQAGAPSTPAASSVPSSAPASSAVPPASTSSSDPQAQLKFILAQSTTQQIAFFRGIVISGGQNAAFAVTDGGDVWYVTSSGAQKLKSGVSYPPDNPSDAPAVWNVNGTELFKCENVPGGSSSASFAWYVKDGKAVELPYTGMNLTYVGNGQFTTMGEAFDMVFENGKEAGGHTYKLYYLYWSADGLKEYGGLKITRQQLFEMDGAQAILDTITKSGRTVDDIYYRANHIINVNYHSGDKQDGNFDNVTLAYQNNTVTPVLVNAGPGTSKTESFNGNDLSDFSYGGVYQAAFFPKIAIYPNKFPAG